MGHEQGYSWDTHCTDLWELASYTLMQLSCELQLLCVRLHIINCTESATTPELVHQPLTVEVEAVIRRVNGLWKLVVCAGLGTRWVE